ncbi:MAG: PP2C family protein-serine/threonine phosphatase, partial [Rhodothermales bacterium]|nr:PP2C family protein-serine/threonine phosphatase [Rhodothermales bacterium]
LLVGSGFEAYTYLEPAQSVVGDFFDIRIIDENRLGFAIGDVSGKGIPAAIFVHGVFTLLRQSLQSGHPPSYCFEQIDGMHRNDAGVFVTLFYGILDLDSGEITYANAGHVPPLLLGSEGVGVIERADNLPLCIVRQPRYVEKTLRLKPGESLLLCTDGVIEAKNTRNEFFGLTGLVRTAGRLRHAAVHDLADALVSEVSEFSLGEEPHDDLTLLVLRWTGR